MKFKVGDKVQQSIPVVLEANLTNVILKGKISRIKNGIYYIVVITSGKLGAGILMSTGDGLTRLPDNADIKNPSPAVSDSSHENQSAPP